MFIKMILESNLPDNFNVATYMIDRNLKEGRGDKIAIYYEEQTLTYREVNDLVNRTGNALKNLGLERENRIMLLMHDCPEFVATFFSAIKIGVVPIPTNIMLKSKDYLYLLNDSRAKVIVVSESLVSVIEAVRPQLRYLEHIIVVGATRPNQLSFHQLIEQETNELTAVETDKDEVAFWLYSSGTTGFPKGAVHLHHDMVVCSKNYAQDVLGITEADKTFSIPKLFFAYGLGSGMFFAFSVGASTVLYPKRPEPMAIFDVLKKYQPSIFFSVPTAYNNMLQYAESKGFSDLSFVRHCVSGGESLPISLFRKWKERFGLAILDGIGSTEALHIYISNRPNDIKVGSSGKPIPGYEAKIVGENGESCPDGEMGTLWIKGDSVAAYYWNKHEKSKETFKGEWLNTGDKYYKDADGYFWNVGRSDDMLKVGGIWVSPLEVENTLLEHPAVLECAVIGATDADSLVKPKAYIVLKPTWEAAAELKIDIQQFIKAKIAPYKYPRWIEFAEELPKTATGKIKRYVLREESNC